MGAIEFIWKKIIDLAAGGVSVLLISHELNEVMQLADTIKVVYEGKLYDGGAHGDLTEEEIGLIMMGGKSDEK